MPALWHPEEDPRRGPETVACDLRHGLRSRPAWCFPSPTDQVLVTVLFQHALNFQQGIGEGKFFAFRVGSVHWDEFRIKGTVVHGIGIAVREGVQFLGNALRVLHPFGLLRAEFMRAAPTLHAGVGKGFDFLCMPELFRGAHQVELPYQPTSGSLFSRTKSLISHSHTMTTSQPILSNSLMFLESRFLLDSNLFIQKDLFDFGR